MMAILRSVLAVVLGLLLAGAFVGMFETLGHTIFPPPKELLELGKSSPEMSLKEQQEAMARPEIQAALRNQPFGAYVFVVVGWVVGGLIGSWAAGLVAGRATVIHAGVMGSLFLLVTVGNLTRFHHPIWMWVVALVLIPLVIFVGGSLADVRLNRPRLVAPPVDA